MDLSIDAADIIRLIQAHLTECGLQESCKAVREESGVLSAGILRGSLLWEQIRTNASTGNWGWILSLLSTLDISRMGVAFKDDNILANVYEMAILELADGDDVALAYATLRLATPLLDQTLGSNQNAKVASQSKINLSSNSFSKHESTSRQEEEDKIPPSRQIAQQLAALTAMRNAAHGTPVGSSSALPKDYYGLYTTKQQRRDKLAIQLTEAIPSIPSSRLIALIQHAIQWQAHTGQLPVVKQHWSDNHNHDNDDTIEGQEGQVTTTNSYSNNNDKNRKNKFKKKRKFDLVLGEATVASSVSNTNATSDAENYAESIPNKVYSTLSFGKKATAQAALFLPDGSGLVTGSSDGLIEIWSSSSRYKELRQDLLYQQNEEFMGHDDDDDQNTDHNHNTTRISAMAISNDGTLLVTGDSKGRIKVWRIDNGKCLREILVHPNCSLCSIDLSIDASHVLTAASPSTTCREYGLRTNRLLKEFQGHTSFINSCRYMMVDELSSLRVITCSADGTARIWDGKSSEMLHILQPYSFGSVVSEKGTSILQTVNTYSNSDSVRDSACPNLHSAIPLHTPSNAIVLVPRGHVAFVVSLTGVVLQTFHVEATSIFVAALVSPSNHWLYAVADRGALHIFEMSSGKQVQVIVNFAAQSSCGSSSANNKHNNDNNFPTCEITSLIHHPHKGILGAFSSDQSQKRGLVTLWK